MASRKLSKTCLVTVGATTGFASLLDAVLSESFLWCLHNHQYVRLVLQCGPSKDRIDLLLQEAGIKSILSKTDLLVETHGLLRTLSPYIRRCAEGGVVIGHAGTGTILDATTEGARLIVVPNPELKDNHQMETAEEFARRGMVLLGDIKLVPLSAQEL